ncbi:MAG: PQQ-binding-like beta-propeller repeat protein, partial [ANME-2 cluster archaeon]
MEIQLMNRKTLMILVLTMVTLALTLPLASASDWTQFHGNVKHTGYSTSNAPVTNHTAWISDDIGADFPSSLTIADGQVFVYCGDHLVSLDEYTGTVLWNVSVNATPKVCGSWVTPAYHGGRVFLSANETCCFDAVDGSRIWTFEPPTGKGAVNGGCAIAEGMVFTSDWDGSHYYCLSVADGTEIWNFTVDGNAQSTPAVSVADDRVFFGSYAYICEDGGVAYCVNMTTGAEIWNFATDNSICGSVTIGDGVVYFTEYNFYGDGALYALYSENGTVKWNKTVERTDSTPALVDGRLYISGGYGGPDNKFTDLLTYCFDASTGDLIWNTSVADEIGDWKCSPAYADGMVFAGRPKPNSMDFEGTYALNASTGEIVWSYPEGGASPAVADGMVFTIGGGTVYAFGPTTIWRGDVALGSGTFNVTADSGMEYTINRTCALASIVRAAEKGGFSYTINDSWYESWGTLYVAEIDGVSDWMYWVNYPDDSVPMVGPNGYELDDGDVVTWYHADSMESTPENTDMLVRIETSYDYWSGDVSLGSGTFNVTADSGMEYTINRTCALAALIRAAEKGGFSYTINDSWYESGGTLYVAEIDGVSDWMY